MRVHLVSIFPHFFDSVLAEGVLRIAALQGQLTVNVVDPRDFTHDRHRTTDDYPYGGGVGMIMKPDPVVAAVESIGDAAERGRVLMPSPQGRLLTQDVVKELAHEPALTILCGRYKAIDERVREVLHAEEISIGDFILAGGEIPALVVLEAVTRLLPGVLGDIDSALTDSFEGGLLDCGYYTRPEEFRDIAVPEVLRSGDHAKIRAWRRRDSLRRTFERRPDMLERAADSLSADDRKYVQELVRETREKERSRSWD